MTIPLGVPVVCRRSNGEIRCERVLPPLPASSPLRVLNPRRSRSVYPIYGGGRWPRRHSPLPRIP